MKAITNTKIITENGLIWDGVILFENGTILTVDWADQVEIPEGAEIIDAQGEYVGPGLVDIHTHTGGDYRLCSGEDPLCDRSGCFMRAFHDRYEKPKGDTFMRIAVTYENGEIFQHFGHTRQFKVYDVKEDKILSAQVIDTAGSGHGALAGVLTALNADVLICGGIGGGAQMALAAAGIRLFGGVSGDADAAVEAFVAGNLAFNPNVKCNHHGEHHHGEGHTCGDHGCGSHSCH